MFLENGIIWHFTELVNMYMKEMGCELLSMTVEEDHVVLSINATASLSPISIFFTLRHNTSGVLRQEYEFLKRSSALWGRGLLLSTKPIAEDVYLRFLDDQKRKAVKKDSVKG